MKKNLYLFLLLSAGAMTAQKTVPTIYGEKVTLYQAPSVNAAVTDWDAYTNPGLYAMNNITAANHGPSLSATPNLILQVTTDPQGGGINQLAYSRFGVTNQIWMRSRTSVATGWTTWSRFLSDID